MLCVVGLFQVRMPLILALSLVRDVVPTRFVSWVRTPRFIDRDWHEVS
jgi:hypothetical protein